MCMVMRNSEGKVSLVYPTIDATTHTFPVEVKLANTHQRIRPGNVWPCDCEFWYIAACGGSWIRLL